MFGNKKKKLLKAISDGDTKKVKALIDAGADIDALGSYGGTALIQAARVGHTKIVGLLIDAGADVDAQDNDGDTALILCAMKGEAECVNALIGAGADINARNCVGFTALMFSTARGHTQTIESLLSAGADVNLRDIEGNTAFDVARTRMPYSDRGLMDGNDKMPSCGWRKLGADEIIFTRIVETRKLVEVFNFSSQERIIFSKNFDEACETLHASSFNEISKERLAEAAAELLKQGGNNHTVAIRKGKYSPSPPN